MEVKCYNKKCLYIWDYRGENKKHICCPKCRFKRIFSKCRTFFLNKNDIQNDRPNDIQGDIQNDIPKIGFETIKDDDGFVYYVDKRIAKQFREASDNEEIEETPIPNLFQEQGIRILPSKLKIIKVIPRDPLKILEHQRSSS